MLKHRRGEEKAYFSPQYKAAGHETKYHQPWPRTLGFLPQENTPMTLELATERMLAHVDEYGIGWMTFTCRAGSGTDEFTGGNMMLYVITSYLI